MPDVDAMIDEITARATDPNRNPNVGNRLVAARTMTTVRVTEPRENRRKSARERDQERNRHRPRTVAPRVTR